MITLAAILLFSQEAAPPPVVETASPSFLERVIREKRWEAVDAEVLRHRDALLPDPSKAGSYVDVVRFVEKRVAAEGGDVVDSYRRAYDARARKLLDEGDDERLLDLYALSSHAPAAADRLAARRYDEGRNDEARRLWSRVLYEFPPTMGAVRAPLVARLKLVADDALAARLRDFAKEHRLEAEIVTVAGQPLKLAEWLASAPPARVPRPDILSPENIRLGVRRYETGKLSARPLTGGDGLPDVTGTHHNFVVPVEGFVNNGWRVAAVEADGSERWASDEERMAKGQTIIVSAPPAIATDAARVFAAHYRPRDYTSDLDPTIVRALDRATGRELWMIEVKTSASSLAAGEGRLVVAIDEVRGADRSLKIAAFDAATGELAWERPIGVTNSDRRARTSLAVLDGRLVVQTNFGLVASLRLSDGVVRWATGYARLKENAAWGKRSFWPFRASGPPVLAGGSLWVLPQDSSQLLCLDPDTGDPLPVTLRPPEGRAAGDLKMRQLLPLPGGIIAIPGAPLSFLRLSDHTVIPVDPMEVRAGALAVVEGDVLALALEGRSWSFTLVDPRDGRVISRWPAGCAGGSVRVTGDLVLVAGEELSAFRLKTIEPCAWRPGIHAGPAGPAARLALAEEARATARWADAAVAFAAFVEEAGDDPAWAADVRRARDERVAEILSHARDAGIAPAESKRILVEAIRLRSGREENWYALNSALADLHEQMKENGAAAHLWQAIILRAAAECDAALYPVAAAEARRRLRALIDAGNTAYDDTEAFAARLSLRIGDDEVERWEEFLRRFPVSATAARAAGRLVACYVKRGTFDAALAVIDQSAACLAARDLPVLSASILETAATLKRNDPRRNDLVVRARALGR